MKTMIFGIKMMPGLVWPVVLLSALVWMAGCATPVGVSRVNEKIVYNQIDSSALTGNSYSSYTAAVLHRHGLNESDFADDPLKFIQNLHEIAAKDPRRDLVLSLSELCFLAGKRAQSAQGKRQVMNYEQAFLQLPPESEAIKFTSEPSDPRTFYRGAMVYAYLFLLEPGSDTPPGPYDRRFRLACDLYNRGLAKLLTFIDGRIELGDKILPLPVGNIHLTVKSIGVPWNPEELQTVLPADEFEIHGLSVRNRLPGMGAPIIALRKKKPGMPVAEAVPATVFAEIKGCLAGIENGNCRAELSIHSTMHESEIKIGEKGIPLEADLTTPIAYSLNDPVLWSLGRNLFRMGRSMFEPGIYPIQPYEPGMIPVVLVHGTMSSPVWWAEMLNTLRSDPKVRKHFQIWLYLYDSGKPVVFSAIDLRESIENKIRQCDPEGKDPALKDIVVIGHSQGGLLARYTVVETGDAIIKAVMGKPLSELNLSPKELALVDKYAVIHPLPEVRRVIFISTPHRGSILAGSFARRMATRFIALPREFIETGTALLDITQRFSVMGKLKWSMARTSIDSMSPDNPALLAVADLPFPPGVKANSIIAIKGDEKPPEGDDGVVAYKSAHIAGVESELVVPYGHSCQMEPVVIEEVRRILIEHLNDMNFEQK